jgi:hypothetical protein
MTLSSATACAVAVPFLTFGILTAFGVDPIPYRHVLWVAEGVIALVAAAYFEFRWFTCFCYQLDLERKRKFSQAQYHFFGKHGESFPGPLRQLDFLANWIERRYSVARAQGAKGAQTN